MQVGLFGKLPSHGDFLRRRLSDAFVAAWDAWLQEGLASSRSALGDRWLDVYLTSPAWRFAGNAGSCGPAPIAGVMVPSVDRVGRFFPLAIVAELPEHVSAPAAMQAAAQFFERAERLAIDTLAAEYVDFEGFDEQVSRLSDDLGPVVVPPSLTLDADAAGLLDGGAPWHLPLGSVDDVQPAVEQLLWRRLSSVYDPLMLWWTGGSSIVDPAILAGRGLPRAASLVALLDGSWTAHGWRTAGATLAPGREGGALIEEPALSFRSAGATDVGRVRQVNQDALLERPEIGLWAVADGLGGHSDGERASRMVCDSLADFQPEPGFDETIEAVRARIQAVNEHLVLDAARSLVGARSGSTVVVLLVRGRRSAILWAGDSRVYRWRGGRLEQLTRDHSPEEPGGAGGRQASSAVTRAVGAHPVLELDLHRDLVLAGDRYLLCSDGLTRVLTEAQMSVWMQAGDVRATVDGLLADTLAAGAPDNVTALVVEAHDGA